MSPCSPTGCTRSSRVGATRSRASCTASLPSSAPSCANTATTRTSTSSSTASPKPLRSSASNPTHPRRPLMATAPGCRGGGERTGGIRRREMLVCGRRFSCRVPHCRGLPGLTGEASVVHSGSLLSGCGVSLSSGLLEANQLLLQ